MMSIQGQPTRACVGMQSDGGGELRWDGAVAPSLARVVGVIVGGVFVGGVGVGCEVGEGVLVR